MTTKEARAAWREKNRERVRAYDRERAKDPARAAIIAARVARWVKDNPDKARATRRRWREKNRESVNARARLRVDHRRRKKLGFDRAAFDALFERQGRCCAICGAHAAKKWVLDHDHETERARGVLCTPCNLALGLFRDCIASLQAAAVYIERHAGLHSLL